MKPALALVAALLTSAPAVAQTAEDDEFLAEVERQERLDEAVLAVDRLVGAILDMPVGRLAEIAPPGSVEGEVRPGDTIRELGTRRDPAFEENVRGGARAMAAVVGNMVQQFETMMPELRAWGERVGEAAPDSIR